MTINEKALEIAKTQIGQEEKPRGGNWGHPVQDYLASVDIHFPAAWCTAFLHWCYDHAAGQMGDINPMLKSGSVLAVWNRTRPQERVSRLSITSLQPGDIFVMDFGGGLGHIGIIEKVDLQKKILHTIEGNTNNDGSREGYAVEQKERPFDNPKIIGFIRYN